MPLYEYECERGRRFEVIQKFSDPTIDDLPQLRRAGAEAVFVARHSVQGVRMVHHRLRPAGKSIEADRRGKSESKRGEGREHSKREQVKTRIEVGAEERLEDESKVESTTEVEERRRKPSTTHLT